jgi:peptide/nickel transport system permease protein
LFRFVLRRLLWALPLLVLITFGAFSAVRASTDPVATFARNNPRATAVQKQAYAEKTGLTGTIPSQYVRWVKRFVSGNLGDSIKTNKPVYDDLKRALANSLVLGGFAYMFAVPIGLGIGILAAKKQYSFFDSFATTSAFVGVSIPPFISGVLVKLLFAIGFTKWLGLDKPFLPTAGIYPPGHVGFDLVLRVKHMILPALVLAIQSIAIYSRLMRASLLEVMNSDYMRTARAKGISETRVLVKHALRNAFIPVVNYGALDIGSLVGGLIITEVIFEQKGMGNYFLVALANGDYPQLMPYIVIVVVSVIVFNLLADLANGWLDPRIRLG